MKEHKAAASLAAIETKNEVKEPPLRSHVEG